MLDRLFDARSVAVIGASDDTRKLRGKLLATLKKSGFDGAIYPVNPSAPEIQGLKAYPTLSAVPEVPDVMLVAIPGDSVPALVQEAVAVGVGGAVIMSSGVDAAALKQAVGNSGMLLFGSNTEGFYHAGNRFAATFAQTVDDHLAAGLAGRASRPGKPISIVSQSGGMGFAIFGRLVKEHVDVHAVITTGNEDVIDCLDVVDHLVTEGRSGTILLFVEGLQEGRRFAATAQRARDVGVSLVVLKVGRSSAGQRAAISHTAHLAGSDTAYDAAFRRHGAVRVDDQETLLAILPALARLPRLAGRRVAIVTTSGGAGTWAADQCENYGVAVPELSEALQRDILAMLPHFASAGNPVDVTGQAVEDGGATLVRVVERLMASDEIDGVLVNMGLAKDGRIAALAPALRSLLIDAAKPVLFHSHIHPSEDNLAAIAELGGVGVRSLRGAAAAFDALARVNEFRPVGSSAPAGAPLIEQVGDGVPDEAFCRRLLNHYDIPTPPASLAGTRDEAVQFAEAMGFPVVLKIQSPDILHKTEAGGVVLNVGPSDIAEAYDNILASVRSHEPQALIEGVLVQKMMPPGQEMIVGILDDPDFGPLVMLGAGGIYAEVMRDTVFSPAPIDRTEALRMIDSLQSAAILKGARGRAPADIAALADLLVKVGELAVTEAQNLRQFDLNPVIVYPEGQGVVAVDALIVAGSPLPAQPKVPK